MLTQGAGLNYLLPQWSPPLNSGYGMRKVMTGVTDDVPQ